MKWRVTVRGKTRGQSFHRECRIEAGSKDEAIAKGAALIWKIEPQLLTAKVVVKCARA